MKAVVIDSDKLPQLYDGPFTLEFFQKAVGGYIEPIPLIGEGHKAILYVNEDGSHLDLPMNAIATALVLGNSDIQAVIVGNVIVVGPADAKGNETSLDDYWLRSLGVTNK